MKIFTHDHGVGSPDEIYVIGRNIVLQIDHALRQDQTDKIWENPSKGLGLSNAHQPNIGVSHQGLDDRGIRCQRDKYSVEFTISQRPDRGRSSQWQQRRAFRIDAGCPEDLHRYEGFRPYPNAFALELRHVLQSLRSTIKYPKNLVVDPPQ